MTPAIVQARAAGISFEVHELAPGVGTGREAATALGVAPGRVLKTLVAKLDGSRLVVAVLPADRELDPKCLAAAAGEKRATLASVREAERSTGYVLGGISPLGLRQSLPIFLDAAAFAYPTIFVSGGRRGLELELRASDLEKTCAAQVAELGRGARA